MSTDRIKTLALSCLLLRALSGCGGGGDGETAPTNRTLTGAQQKYFAAQAVSLVGLGASFSSAAQFAQFFSQAKPSSGQSLACDAGAFSRTVNDANGNSKPDVGDSVTLNYADCTSADGRKVNGQAVYSVISVDGDLSATDRDSALGLRLDYKHLAHAAADDTTTLNGSIRFAFGFLASAQRSTVDASSAQFELSSAAKGKLTLSRFAAKLNRTTGSPGITVEALSADLSGASSDAGGALSVNIVQTQPQWINGAGEATAGAFKVDGNVGVVQIDIANAGSIAIRYDAAKDGAFESNQTASWAELLALADAQF